MNQSSVIIDQINDGTCKDENGHSWLTVGELCGQTWGHRVGTSCGLWSGRLSRCGQEEQCSHCWEEGWNTNKTLYFTNTLYIYIYIYIFIFNQQYFPNGFYWKCCITKTPRYKFFYEPAGFGYFSQAQNRSLPLCLCVNMASSSGGVSPRSLRNSLLWDQQTCAGFIYRAHSHSSCPSKKQRFFFSYFFFPWIRKRFPFFPLHAETKSVPV